MADVAPTERPSEAQPAAPVRLPHRVVVVGGGFAGLYAARSLGIDPEVRVTLVDRRNFHLFQPMLYQVATGVLSPAEIAQPLRSILRKRRNTTVILGEATGIDLERLPGGAVGRRADRLRHADRRDRGPPLVFRPPGVGADRAGAQDHRGRDRDPPPDPHRVRGRGARGRPRPSPRVDDVRAGRRRTDRRRARRARSARSPASRSGTTSGPSTPRTPGSSWSRRWTGSCRRTRRTAPRRRSASSSGSA